MAFPVTLNGRTYTLTDFEGTNYVDGLPDAFEDFVTQAGQIYSTTSTTSNSIGTGSKTFTVEASKPYQVGTPLRIADTAAVSTNWIDGIVTAYSGTTLTVDAVAYAGGGTKTAWSINIGGGPIAYTGTLPIAQGGTGATTAAAAQTNLDVYSKADADSRFLNVSDEASDVTISGSLTTSGELNVVAAGGGDAKITIENTNSPRGNFIGIDGSDNIIIASDEDNLGSDSEIKFRIDADQKMVLTNDGRLGLGVAAPSAFLEINMGSNTSDLTGVLIATENDSNATGPDLAFRRRSASPADGDAIGALHFYGDNSASQDTRYARIFVQTRDVSDSTEDGTIQMNVTKGGADINVLSVTSVNAGNNAGMVGINVGGETPSGALDVRGDTPFIDIRDNTSGSWQQNDVFSGIRFRTSDPDVGGAGQVHAFVKAIHTRTGTGHSNPDAGLIFGTSDNITPTAIERMRITEDGFVGINESDPQSPLHITRDDNSDFIRLECTDGDASEGPQIHFYRNSASPADGDKLGVIKFRGNNSSNSELNFVELQTEAQDITASTEDSRLRIVVLKAGNQRNMFDVGSSEVIVNNDAQDVNFRVETPSVTHMLFLDAGNNQLKIGNNTAAGGQEGNSYFSLSSPSSIRAADFDRATTTANNHLVNFYSNVGGTNTLNAVIEASGDLENTNNRYTGFSDERFKQDIVDASSQWDDIKALQVRKYRFKNHVETMGDDAAVQLGVIAQELEASGMNGLVKTKPIDENDPDGPDRKSVAYSVLYMKAVKALQEAMERIETLEAKVAALEAN